MIELYILTTASMIKNHLEIKTQVFQNYSKIFQAMVNEYEKCKPVKENSYIGSDGGYAIRKTDNSHFTWKIEKIKITKE